jgi:SAM-dependent methyltransferase
MLPHSSAPDSKDRFSSRVDAYVAARPRYPVAVIELLKQTIGLTPAWNVVDVGSGTGISCEMFLENGNAVTAVEPNAPMRQAAERTLGPRFGERFRSVGGSAEATTLPDASADLVVAAQAMHWFDIEKSRIEFRRILKPGGYALLMWNVRRIGVTPFLVDYENLLLTYGTDYAKVRHENIDDAARARFFGPGGYQSAKFANHQHLDWEVLRLRLLSSSYTPPEGDARHAPMLAELRAIFDRHNAAGRVTIEYETELFYGPLK